MADAFLTAGAQSVVATAWRVPDAETAALMEQLYYWIGRGEDRVEALRRAKLALARSEGASHPYYWAGVVMYSKVSGPVVSPIPWLIWILLLSCGLLVLWHASRRLA